MEKTTTFDQSDIDLLFQIEYGRHEVIDTVIAGRLTVKGFLREMENAAALQALTSIEVDGKRCYLGLTTDGREFLAKTRDGLTEFREWKPE